MRKEGTVDYACGGVGVEERNEMKALESQANVEFTFATIKRGAYLADVSITITDAKSKSPVLKTMAEGPLCLLRLAPGTYRVEATHAGATRARTFTASRDQGRLVRIGFGFPEEPGDGT